MSIPATLLSLLHPRLDRPTMALVESAVAAMTAPLDLRALRAEWSRLGRRTGAHPVAVTREEADRLRVTGPWPVSAWGLDEVSRVALLARALAVAERDTHLPLVQGLYLRGTIRERQAVLRALFWLPDPGRFTPLAEEATRAHVVSVFEAIALENPFPARFFVRPIFEQMVQKVIRLRLAPERVHGVADRATADAVRLPPTPRPAHPSLPALVAP